MRKRVILLPLLLIFVMTAAIPVRASEKEKGTPDGTGTSAGQEVQNEEPDPASALKVTAIDFGDDGWGDGTMIESAGECMLMDTFMPECED